MKKFIKYSLITVIGLAILAAIPVVYYQHKINQHPFEHVILAKVKKRGHAGISNWLADTYLKYGRYNPKGYDSGGAIPYFNFSLYLYRPRYQTQNQRVFDIAKLLLDKGADINAVDKKNGSTALHGAIQQTLPEVVDFLIKNNVDPTRPILAPGKPWHGMDASKYAKYYVEALKGDAAHGVIVKISAQVDDYMKVYLSKHPQKAAK